MKIEMSKTIKDSSEWFGEKYNWTISITRSKNSKPNKLKVKHINQNKDD